MAELELDDGTIWYETIGDGPPLVFVHGGWMDGTTWEPQIEHFADDYRVVTLDVRGHGNTGVTEPDQYSIDSSPTTSRHCSRDSRSNGQSSVGSRWGRWSSRSIWIAVPTTRRARFWGGAVRSMPPWNCRQE